MGVTFSGTGGARNLGSHILREFRFELPRRTRTQAMNANKPNVIKGQKYRSRHQIEVQVLTHWRAAFTGGHKARLRPGQVIVVCDSLVEGASAVACLPDDPKGLESELVPDIDRQSEKYAGYSLVIFLNQLGEDFELV